MKRIILIRHGETVWNKEKRIMGWADIPLNETGREQARKVGSTLKAIYDIEVIYSSDLSRTMETARIIKDIACPDAEIKSKKAFREMNPGVFSGVKYYEIPPEMDIMKLPYEKAIDLKREGGETLKEFNDRVTTAFAKLIEKLPEVSLISTHSGVVSSIIGKIKGYNPLESLLNINPKNCAFHYLIFDETSGKIEIAKENQPVY